jgi:hypothetical protein
MAQINLYREVVDACDKLRLADHLTDEHDSENMHHITLIQRSIMSDQRDYK